MRIIKEYWFLLVFVGGIVFNYAVVASKAESASEEVKAIRKEMPSKDSVNALFDSIGQLRTDIRELRTEIRGRH